MNSSTTDVLWLVYSTQSWKSVYDDHIEDQAWTNLLINIPVALDKYTAWRNFVHPIQQAQNDHQAYYQ